MPASVKKKRPSSANRTVSLGALAPLSRPLKAYAFDPSQGKILGNEMSVRVRYQRLDPGPVVRYHAPNAIAVVDYDGTNKIWYKPVDLNDERILLAGGLDPSESDPRFHQQMVYAVVTDTIQHFEAALGRRIHWRRQERHKNSPQGPLPGDIYTLNLYPHAMVSANAFYSPKAHGILFGYFRADAQNPGRNLPGQTVFTCLSHDVVVHETTHAIIDGIRSYFTEYTNPDVPAFHEAFADVAALFRHFTHEEVLLDAIQRTGGAIYRYQLQPETTMFGTAGSPAPGEAPTITEQIGQGNPLIELAKQFGEATGRGASLRSALGTKPNSMDIKKVIEPHLRGSILVAAIFDAYFSIYVKRTADLFRIYRAGGGRLDSPDIPDPLAKRLASEAARTADEFFRVCVRALDYCPPVDVTFGEFLRALITTARDLDQVDEVGVRDSFMQAFRLRGIVPETASFFSEAAIAYPIVDPGRVDSIEGLDFGDPNGLSRQQKETNAVVLKQYANLPANKRKLGFDLNFEVTVPSYHPTFRIGHDGSLRSEMVVEMVQRRDVAFEKAGRNQGHRGQQGKGLGYFPLRGGATVVISRPTVAESGNIPDAAPIRYVIAKQLHGSEGALREERQRTYLQHLGLVEGTDPDRFEIDFAMVHEGL